MRKEVTSAYEWTEELTGISTGSLAIDRILGKVAGFPRGRLTEVMGWESSGKTTLCIGACANAQAAGLHATYVDPERGVDLKHAKLMSFEYDDPERGAYLTPRTMEETFKLVDGLIDEVKSDLIVVDSVAAMVPEGAMDGVISDVSPIAHRARLLSQYLPRIANKVAEQKVAVVFVNQMRMKINTGWSPNRGKPDEQSPGGSALRFFASLRLQLKQIKKNQTARTVIDDVSGKEVEIATQGKHNCYAMKNKISDPYRDTDFYIRFDEENKVYGVDNLQTIIDAAKAQDVVLVKSGGHMRYESATDPSRNFKVQGDYPLYLHLLNHADTVVEIRELLKAKGLF